MTTAHHHNHHPHSIVLPISMHTLDVCCYTTQVQSMDTLHTLTAHTHILHTHICIHTCSAHALHMHCTCSAHTSHIHMVHLCKVQSSPHRTHLPFGHEHQAIKHVIHLGGGLVERGNHYLAICLGQRAQQLEQRESTATVQSRGGLLMEEENR